MSLLHPNYGDTGFDECMTSLNYVDRFIDWPTYRQFTICFNEDKVPSVIGLRYLHQWSVNQEPITPRPIPLVLAMGNRKDDTAHCHYNTNPHFFVTRARITVPSIGLPSKVVLTQVDLLGHDNQMSCFMIDMLSRMSRHEEYKIEFLYSTAKPFQEYTEDPPKSTEISAEDVYKDPSKVETVFLKAYNKYL